MAQAVELGLVVFDDVCVYEPTEKFWALWSLNKAELKSNGYTVCKIKNKWLVLHLHSKHDQLLKLKSV